MASIEKRENDKGITYRVKVRLRGQPVQTATFERLTDARRWAQQTEVAIREGRHFKTVEAKKHTLGEMLDRYQKNILPTLKSGKGREVHITWWKEQLGDYMLSEIRPSRIAELRDDLANETLLSGEKRSPSTVNRYLATLSHSYTTAVKEWGWVEENPVFKISRPKEPRGRVRFLSDEERTRLLTACQESDERYLYPVVVVALATGARRGEILNLRWQDVDFERGVILLEETKNGERRILPLVGHAQEVLKKYSEIRRIDTPLLFPSKNPAKPKEIHPAWTEALKAAKVKDFRFHDLHHSAASYLAMNGASLAEIAEVLGHKTLQMVKRYSHLSEAHTASIVSKMNEKIFG